MLGANLSYFQDATGVDVKQDIAASLGGEMTISVDGPLLPVPSWKVVAEVNNPEKLEWSIEQVIKAAQKNMPDGQIQFTHEIANGLTFYSLSSQKMPVPVVYTYTNGYLLAASSRDLLTSSLSQRAAGTAITQSQNFRALLPMNGQMNFSALLYYNAGSMLGPMADQLKSTGLLTPEQQKAINTLTANREPTLIYAYAESDRIRAATRASFFGFGLDTLLGLNERGAGTLFSQFMNPALKPTQ